MPIGFRAFLEIERPDPQLVEAYRQIPSSNIGDCVKRMNCMFGGIRSYNRRSIVGPAFTVKVPAGDNLVAQMALDYAQPGDVIVIDGAGYADRALVGGMMLAYAEKRGLAGRSDPTARAPARSTSPWSAADRSSCRATSWSGTPTGSW